MVGSLQAPGVQEAAVSFFGPVVLAYAVAMVLWLVVARVWPKRWPRQADAVSDRPWLDLAIVFAVVVGVLGLGQLFMGGWLLPRRGSSWPLLSYTINQLIIWSPLFVALVVRRQGGHSVWVSREGLLQKLVVGFIIGLVAVAVFLLVRGDMATMPAVLQKTVTAHSLSHFFPVFMEGVALAFLFVRLRWVAGEFAALLLPALLFAVAHVPRGLESGSSGGEIAAFFVLNTVLVTSVLAVVRNSRDVIWLGIVHYLVDVPSGAF